MQYLICRHIKTNGLQCQAPALTDGDYCYFHARLLQRHTPYRHTDKTRGYLIPGQHIQLTALEDRESVQVALSVVINALATGQLDTKRATTLLYGLQLASINCARLNTQPYAPEVILSAQPTSDGLDLAEPGTMLEILPFDPIEEEREEEEDEIAEEEAAEARQRERDDANPITLWSPRT